MLSLEREGVDPAQASQAPKVSRGGKLSPYGAVPPERVIWAWWYDLKAWEPDAERFEPLLSSEEAARAARLAPEQKRRWVTCRGLLRQALGRSCAMQAKAVDIRVGLAGKPYLAQGPQFSLSHSGDWMLLAMSQGVALGCDAEERRPIPELLDLAARSFRNDEIEVLRRLPGPARLEAFLSLWTYKESWLKCLGLGLPGGEHLAACGFSLRGGCLMATGPAPVPETLCGLPGPGGIKAALAALGHQDEVIIWNDPVGAWR